MITKDIIMNFHNLICLRYVELSDKIFWSNLRGAGRKSHSFSIIPLIWLAISSLSSYSFSILSLEPNKGKSINLVLSFYGKQSSWKPTFHKNVFHPTKHTHRKRYQKRKDEYSYLCINSFVNTYKDAHIHLLFFYPNSCGNQRP